MLSPNKISHLLRIMVLTIITLQFAVPMEYFMDKVPMESQIADLENDKKEKEESKEGETSNTLFQHTPLEYSFQASFTLQKAADRIKEYSSLYQEVPNAPPELV